MSDWISPHDVARARRFIAELPEPARRLLPWLGREMAGLAREATEVIATGWRWALRRRGWLALLAAVGGFAIFRVVAPHDVEWLAQIQRAGRAHSSDAVRRVARFVSWAGDFAGFNLAVILTMLVWAKWRQQARWRGMAVMCLVGSLLCGGLAVAGRFAFGRARPSSREQPVFHGPDLRAHYQSFPSGHTATAFGLAVPLTVAAPVIGAPVLLAAATISWSRLERNQHYPSDILSSILIALMVGIPLGSAARSRRRDASSGEPP